MALWQFEFSIIPQGRDGRGFSNNDIISWKNVNISIDIDSTLSLILPKKENWSDDIKLYGENDSTSVELIYEDSNLNEILCRLDLRNLKKQLLIDILDFVKVINGDIFYDGVIIELNLENIVEIMTNSKVARFCSDPGQYLSSFGGNID